MACKVDPEVLAGFVEEARSYLPTIRRGLDEFRAAPDQVEKIEEAHRHVHTIKGSASMVGLLRLSHLAYQLEEAIEDLAAGKLPATAATVEQLQSIVTLLDSYLAGMVSGRLDEDAIAGEATRICRKLRGLPDAASAAGMAPSPDGPEGGLRDVFDLPPSGTADPAEDDTAPVSLGVTPEEVSPELLEVFTLEAEDHLRNISALLPALEQKPDSKELLQDVRRSVHTLKGAAAMVNFREIMLLAHRMEDLLDQLYEGSRSLTPDVIPLLFASTDALEDMAGGKTQGKKFEELYARYTQLLKSEAAVTRPAPSAPEPAMAALLVESADALAVAPESPAPAAHTQPAAQEPGRTGAPRKQGQFVRIPFERLDDLVKLVSELVITRTAFEQRMTDFLRQVDELQPSTARLRRVSYKLETDYEASALGGGPLTGGGRHGPVANGPVNRLPGAFGGHGFDDLELDRYTEFHLLSRELAETTNDIQTVGGELGHLIGDFDSYLNRQARLSSEIEDKLMRLRMVPLATLASRLHRTVRNVANQQGKQVELVLDGESTELDKTVLEEMADPLMHLLRNAVDHGIEPPELRQVRGKAAKGVIHLRAYHEGSQVVVQISDDGAGIEPEVLRSTAVSRGFVASADAARMSAEELRALLFLPGFSTAQAVSEISGRGVGLDIVQSQVHKLKGTLALESRPGQGAAFTIRLPMTLAITRALLVRAHQQTFALPLDSVRQILRLERDELEKIGQEPVLRVGGQVYPLLSLGKCLGLKQPAETLSRAPVLLLSTGARQVALVVDQLLGGREIVIKNLGSHLRRVRGVTGATLMGDGSVVLILNPADLVPESTAVKAPVRPLPAAPSPRAREALTIMVVDDSPSVRRVVANLIKSAGWQTVVAKDGLEALEVLQQTAQPPDLILLDIEMPRMDGYELLSNLQRQEAYRDIPVVMVTSRAGQKHRRKAMELGAANYLVKPYQDEALLAVIRQLARGGRSAVRA